jgi:hypothetical protein
VGYVVATALNPVAMVGLRTMPATRRGRVRFRSMARTRWVSVPAALRSAGDQGLTRLLHEVGDAVAERRKRRWKKAPVRGAFNESMGFRCDCPAVRECPNFRWVEGLRDEQYVGLFNGLGLAERGEGVRFDQSRGGLREIQREHLR